jgi:hypothetical protein
MVVASGLGRRQQGAYCSQNWRGWWIDLFFPPAKKLTDFESGLDCWTAGREQEGIA